MAPEHESDSAAFFSRPQLYGGFGGFRREEKAFFLRSQRHRMNMFSICQCLILPWLLFCFVYAVTSFSWHYSRPKLCFGLVALGLLAVLASGGAALAAGLSKLANKSREPNWYVFLFVTTLISWVLGVVLGDLNFETYSQLHYDYMNLNRYVEIDPVMIRGQRLMDAGTVHFINTTALDLRRSMGFRNLDTYCVAPITVRSADASRALLPLASYDFWAVGLDCCSGNSNDFHCGEYNNPRAHGGFRLLKDDQRAFFRLAVQQAEAEYQIKATHPLFFHWAEDPSAEVDSFRREGLKYYLIGMLAHFGWQLLCVALAVIAFARLGHF